MPYAFVFLWFCIFLPFNALAGVIQDFDQTETHIVVDKKTNALYLVKYDHGKLEPFKSYHTTMGKKIGDKLIDGDLRTPEGIYQFEYRSYPPALKPIFGPLAIYISYPNPYDKAGRQTGYDILLHGTDDPSRLEKNYDSKGCVVLNNNEVEEVSKYIKLKDTKIIVTRDFSKINGTHLEALRDFLRTWLTAWESKDIDTYLDSYGYEFKFGKMDRIAYRKYKDNLNKLYEKIDINATNVRYFPHEKYDLITFRQEYSSTLNGGKPGYHGEGQKTLYVQNRNGKYQIVIEDMKN